MPAVSTLKNSRAREKRALIKEEAEAQKSYKSSSAKGSLRR